MQACAEHWGPLPTPHALPHWGQALRALGYTVRQAPPSSPLHGTALYATKGQLGRVGPMLVHVAIISLMLAYAYGALTQFTAQMLLAQQQSSTLAQAQFLQTPLPAPWWLGHLPPWRLVVKDFKVDFYPQAPSMAQQYTSTLALLEPQTGRVLAQGTTAVNHPFTRDGVTIYQASFQLTGRHLLRLNGQPQWLQASTTLLGRPCVVKPLPPNGPNAGQVWLFPFHPLKDGAGITKAQLQLLYFPAKGTQTSSPQRITLMEGAPAVRWQGQQWQYERAELATGLQIKGTPEVPWVYASLLLLSLGILCCTFKQRQLWLSVEGNPEGKPQEKQLLWAYAKTRKGQAAYAAWLGQWLATQNAEAMLLVN